jgi:hypothetical protein
MGTLNWLVDDRPLRTGTYCGPQVEWYIKHHMNLSLGGRKSTKAEGTPARVPVTLTSVYLLPHMS